MALKTVFIVLSLLACLYGFNQDKNKIAKWLNLFFLNALILILVKWPITNLIGSLLLLISALAALFYPFIAYRKDKSKLLPLLLVIVPVSLKIIAGIMHWPFSNIFNLLLPLPVLTMLWIGFKRRQFQDELGLLIYFWLQAVFILVSLI